MNSRMKDDIDAQNNEVKVQSAIKKIETLMDFGYEVSFKGGLFKVFKGFKYSSGIREDPFTNVPIKPLQTKRQFDYNNIGQSWGVEDIGQSIGMSFYKSIYEFDCIVDEIINAETLIRKEDKQKKIESLNSKIKDAEINIEKLKEELNSII